MALSQHSRRLVHKLGPDQPKRGAVCPNNVLLLIVAFEVEQKDCSKCESRGFRVPLDKPLGMVNLRLVEKG